jgi:hypothetical protein
LTIDILTFRIFVSAEDLIKRGCASLRRSKIDRKDMMREYKTADLVEDIARRVEEGVERMVREAVLEGMKRVGGRVHDGGRGERKRDEQALGMGKNKRYMNFAIRMPRPRE